MSDNGGSVVCADLDIVRDHRRSTSTLTTFIHEIGEHLPRSVFVYQNTCSKGELAYLDGIEWPTGGLRMELNTPDPLAGLWSRDDTFDRRVVTVDKEWCPSLGE